MLSPDYVRETNKKAAQLDAEKRLHCHKAQKNKLNPLSNIIKKLLLMKLTGN